MKEQTDSLKNISNHLPRVHRDMTLTIRDPLPLSIMTEFMVILSN